MKKWMIVPFLLLATMAQAGQNPSDYQQGIQMMESSPFNTIFWISLKSPDESNKACIADLEKSTILIFGFDEKTSTYFCKHRTKASIAQAADMETQAKQYYAQYEQYLADTQTLGGIPAATVAK